MDSYIGKLIDKRYAIESLIGVGGMSNVYKATDRKTGKSVAVKFLKQEFFENEELVRRFKNESKAISLLNHPNIIKVIDVNIDSEKKYIVVEYIDGITLKEYIENRKVLTYRETVRFTRVILAAVGHAHDNGIIHRDLKPQNVMILRDGTLKIMDFGIARLSTASQKTVTDKAIGSVHYISPEQVKGKESDERSDIYSIGVMMYEMLTGKLPFTGDSAMQVAMKQLNDRPQPPGEIVSDISKGLEQIVLKAMEKNPKKRFSSAKEMSEDIEAFMKDPKTEFDYDTAEEEGGSTRVISVDEMGKTKKKRNKFNIFDGDNKKNGKSANLKHKKTDWLKKLAKFTRVFFVACMIAVTLIFKMSDNPLLEKRDDVEMPNLVGMTESQLKDSGYKFKYNIEYSYSGKYGEGVIFLQNPKPPQSIKENGTVRLKVSKGPLSSQIKDLSGYPRSEAEEYLSDMDVNISIVVQRSDSIKTGRVIRTEPGKGSIVQSGDLVTLYVSLGDGSTNVTKVTVPNVVGASSLEDARKILGANSLSAGTYSYEYNDSPRGTIIAQEPEAGTKLMAGQGVSMVISQGPMPPPPEPESSSSEEILSSSSEEQQSTESNGESNTENSGSVENNEESVNEG